MNRDTPTWEVVEASLRVRSRELRRSADQARDAFHSEANQRAMGYLAGAYERAAAVLDEALHFVPQKEEAK